MQLKMELTVCRQRMKQLDAEVLELRQRLLQADMRTNTRLQEAE
jgi:hypothetical protein